MALAPAQAPGEVFSDNMDKVRHWIELSLIPGVGPKTFLRLLDHLGSPKDILGSSRSALESIKGVSSAAAEAIGRGAESELDKSLRLIEERGVTVVTLHDPAYPERLKQINDPPPLLYIKGTLQSSDRNAVSLVGSRRATHYGKTVARQLAGDLARMGITVVSGLAYGVDATAHKGALAAGGRTIAVLGCGVDVVYPRANAKIHERIPVSGALMSEFPSPRPDFFLFEIGSSAVCRSALSSSKPRARAARSLPPATRSTKTGRSLPFRATFFHHMARVATG